MKACCTPPKVRRDNLFYYIQFLYFTYFVHLNNFRSPGGYLAFYVKSNTCPPNTHLLSVLRIKVGTSTDVQQKSNQYEKAISCVQFISGDFQHLVNVCGEYEEYPLCKFTIQNDLYEAKSSVSACPIGSHELFSVQRLQQDPNQ